MRTAQILQWEYSSQISGLASKGGDGPDHGKFVLYRIGSRVGCALRTRLRLTVRGAHPTAKVCGITDVEMNAHCGK